MAKSSQKIPESLKTIEAVGGRAGSDTLRLWEGYRDQAYQWRALALIQMPTTFLALLSMLIMYLFADTIVEVPDLPQPGFYSAKRLPDSQFINASTQFINLTASYQPRTADQQFKTARGMLWEPALSEFEKNMMGIELEAIVRTSRSQMFFVEENLIKLERYPEEDRVVARIPGTRQKLIGDKPVPADELVYLITMTTIPRTEHNPYGIVITNVDRRQESLKEIENADRKEQAKKERELRRAQRMVTEPQAKQEEFQQKQQ